MLPIIYQEPTALSLHVIEGATPLNLTVIEAQRVSCGLWTVDFEIVGESHRVCLSQAGQVTWQEVLACTQLPPEQAQHQHAFSQLTAHCFATEGYRVQVTFTTGEGPGLRLDRPNLTATFPPVFGQQPVTQLAWEVSPAAIQWRSLHIYPLRTHTVTVSSFSTYCL